MEPSDKGPQQHQEQEAKSMSPKMAAPVGLMFVQNKPEASFN